ncbi:MAG TPA: hypothetical protein VLD39_15405, partial [Gammaproteobacteria bacterium]|nr:hypothetical protein [Gammaproteobacteria bacterium]
AINYSRSIFIDPVFEPIPWAWASAAVVESEVAYNDREKEFFTGESDAARCVIRFDEYKRDLGGVLQRVYRDCFDCEPPESAPTEHTPRERHNYRVNRTLKELGIDEEALNERSADYIAWCKGD